MVIELEIMPQKKYFEIRKLINDLLCSKNYFKLLKKKCIQSDRIKIAKAGEAKRKG